ncbi:hypothetical protein VPNG_03305 [Cytospora leucostoma]|uniref:chitinase n=1 Tax=Cytospora leucostoma TaxID=1230097 RepID=A0A423XFF0_9PEZI|nr:hypothetical protein VPNG_03305 [Cytospora leucostoma]
MRPVCRSEQRHLPSERGSTDEFCDTGCQEDYGSCGAADTPSCSGSSASARRIGYYESWSSTRGCDSRKPADLDLTGLTHLNFAFAYFNPTTLQITSMNSGDATLYTEFTAVKSQKPSLQTWISIGGWSFNDEGNSPSTRTAFSDMVSTSANRATFINSLHFDVVSMEKYLDWFNFMSYDIHGVWDSSDKYTGPYIRPHTNLTEIEDGLSLLWRAGVDPSNVVLGLGWYGRSFTLADSACTTPNGICEFTAGGDPGECTASSRTLSDAELKRILDSGVGVEGYDETATVRWLTWNTNHGKMIWAIDLDNTDGDSMDDLLGIGEANGVTEAEAQEYKDQLNNATLQNDIASSCYWSFCGDTCDNGYFDVTEAKGQVANVQQNSVCSDDTWQTLCCASGTTLGTCQWEGFRGVGLPCTPVCNSTDAVIVAQNSNAYYEDDNGQTVDHTCTGGYQAFCCEGFKASTKTNTGDLFLYGQGVLSKRDLSTDLEKRGVGKGVLTAAVCAAAVSALIATAPFTFGLSLLGIPAEIALCAAAGGSSNAITRPYTGVPTTVGSGKKARSSYGQWPILDFGNVAQTSSCDCFVTYTCNYGMGWDEICDNQQWAIDKKLGGKTVYSPRQKGRAPKRNYSSWANKQRSAPFRTLLQKKRQPQSARCELDEFSMGNMHHSGGNKPQVCRLVNGPANGAQGQDWNYFKLAQWHPCSAFRSKVCKSKDEPPVTWKLGALNGNRGNANGKHFISAYGFDSQTGSSLCFASYSYTDNAGKKTDTMVADHGFRALDDDPMFNSPFRWERQDYWMNPAPQKAAPLRPVDIASAAYQKRAAVEATLRNRRLVQHELLCTAYARHDDDLWGDLSGPEAEQVLDYRDFDFEDEDGNPVDGHFCDAIYDSESGLELFIDGQGNVFEVYESDEMDPVLEMTVTSVASSIPERTIEPASPSSTLVLVPVSTTASIASSQTVLTAAPEIPTEWPSGEFYYEEDDY